MLQAAGFGLIGDVAPTSGASLALGEGSDPPGQPQGQWARRQGLVDRYRRLWSLADLALSGLTSAGLSIVVARSVGQAGFATFSLALMTFGFAIGMARALISDVFVIQFSDALAPHVRREAARRATGAALVLGALFGALGLVAAVLVRGQETRAVLFVLALALPGLIVQDCFRYVFFAAGRPAVAVANDVLWAGVLFTVIGLLIRSGHSSVLLITLIWGVAALLAAVVAGAGTGVVPAPRQAGLWFALNRHLGVRMGIDYVLNAGAMTAGIYLIGAVVGLVGVGALRATQILLGPLQLLSSGAAAAALPAFSVRAAAGLGLVGPATLISSVVTAAATLWVRFLLDLPESLGRQVLGDSWDAARPLLLICGLSMIVTAVAIGPSIALRALGRGDLLLRVMRVQSPVILGLAVAGALWSGVDGAAAGFALAQVVGAVALWVLFLRAARITT